MTNGETDEERERAIFRVTILGGIINMLLVALKFVAGILGCSAAMVADAVHSLSDTLTDIFVLIFVHVGNQPADREHAYGHGKFETLATFLVGALLLGVGGYLSWQGVEKILLVLQGEYLPVPGWLAFWAAVISILFKEFTYRITMRVGRQVHSDVTIANAWHHRTDALSSIGSGLGIGCAILLGDKWVVLDPLASIIVSIFVIVAAIRILRDSLDELLEHSLSDEVQRQIRAIVAEDKAVSELHNLRTRKMGNRYAIEMHLRMPGSTTLFEAHTHSMELENRLKQHFGRNTHIAIHIEPVKVNGHYEAPGSAESV